MWKSISDPVTITMPSFDRGEGKEQPLALAFPPSDPLLVRTGVIVTGQELRHHRASRRSEPNAGEAKTNYAQFFLELFGQLADNLLKEFWENEKTVITRENLREKKDELVNLSDDQVLRLIHLKKFVPEAEWDSVKFQHDIAQTIANFLSLTQAHPSNSISFMLPGSKVVDQAQSYEYNLAPFNPSRVSLFRLGLIVYAHGAFKLVLPPRVASRMEFYFGGSVMLFANGRPNY